MTDPPFRIRAFLPEDFEKIVELEAQGQTLEQACFRTAPLDLAESLSLPNRLPEKDLFVVAASGDIAGYIYVMPELDIGRAILSCFIHPNHGRKDVAIHLVERALRRARELGVERAQVNIHQENPITKKLFSEMGFGCVRRFLEMSLDISECTLPEMSDVFSVCRHLEPGEEEKLTFIQNRSFVDTWGYNPNTKEEIGCRTQLPNCSPQNVLLMGEEEHPIGYCWTKINSGGKKHTRNLTGHIHMLGVDPDHRGKGIGKQVLLAGIAYLQGEGIRLISLTVDEENKAACELYRSLGFEISGQTVWYEKVLD